MSSLSTDSRTQEIASKLPRNPGIASKLDDFVSGGERRRDRQAANRGVAPLSAPHTPKKRPLGRPNIGTTTLLGV